MRNLEVVPFPYGALRTPDYVDFYTLGSTSKAIVPPSSATVAMFAADVNFFANYGTTAVAVVPSTTADVTDGSGSEMNPSLRYFTRGTTQMNLVAQTTGRVTISWWKHP